MTTILLVDDSTSIRNFLEVAGGRAGLEQVRPAKLDLIFADQNKPGLVLTTETSDEMKAQFCAADPSGWIAKPFTPERLEAALKKLLT